MTWKPKNDAQLVDLLLPGLYGAIARETNPKESLDQRLCDNANQWLREWAPQHRADFKDTFHTASIAWVRQAMKK